jgi:hypothetical protein
MSDDDRGCAAGGGESAPPAVRAVVDRIGDGVATLLVGEDEREVAVEPAELPEGAVEGSWLLVREGPAGLRIVGVDEPGAAARHREAENRLDRLRRDRGSGRFPPRT